MRDKSEQVAERVRQVLAQRAGETADEGIDDDVTDSAGNIAGFLGVGYRDRAESGFGGGSAAPAAALGHRGPPRIAWRERVSRLGESWPVRLDPGRGAALAVGVAVLLAALVTGGWVLLQRPASVPVSAAGASPSGLGLTSTPVGTGAAPEPSAVPGGGSSRAATSSPDAVEVVVDVAGKVHEPGLYRLPPGSRIDDAVRAAGGQLRGVDLSSLNLAQKLVDGQQIVVGAPAVSGAAGAGSSAPAGASSAGSADGTATAGAPVNLNTATLEQLETLPGVGPVLGQHIIDYRTQHGSFTSVAQLDDVSGIGTVKFAELQPVVTV